MKECLNCKSEFKEQRSTAKFCSNKCRAAYNRQRPENKVTKVQLQVLYNAFLDAVGKIQYSAPKEVYDAPKKPNIQDEPLSFDKLKEDITSKDPANLERRLYAASTSEELQKLYNEIEKSGLPFMARQRLHNIGKQIFKEKFDF